VAKLIEHIVDNPVPPALRVDVQSWARLTAQKNITPAFNRQHLQEDGLCQKIRQPYSKSKTAAATRICQANLTEGKTRAQALARLTKALNAR